MIKQSFLIFFIITICFSLLSCASIANYSFEDQKEENGIIDEEIDIEIVLDSPVTTVYDNEMEIVEFQQLPVVKSDDNVVIKDSEEIPETTIEDKNNDQSVLIEEVRQYESELSVDMTTEIFIDSTIESSMEIIVDPVEKVVDKPIDLNLLNEEISAKTAESDLSISNHQITFEEPHSSKDTKKNTVKWVVLIILFMFLCFLLIGRKRKRKSRTFTYSNSSFPKKTILEKTEKDMKNLFKEDVLSSIENIFEETSSKIENNNKENILEEMNNLLKNT